MEYGMPVIRVLHPPDCVIGINEEILNVPDLQAPLPVRTITDTVDRDIEFTPTKVPYDPRWMLEGRLLVNPRDATANTWQTGFFDRGSWDEIMSAWAKTVS